MAAAATPNPNPTDPGQVFAALIERLRLYNPPVSADTDASADDDRREVLSSIVARAELELFKPKRAAVLICIFDGGDGGLRVFLTKRSSNLSSHSGEVSLPGGKAEDGDADDAETALREAREEIGLDPSLVTVVGVLEPFLSKHLLRVVPVIGILSDRQAFKPVPNDAEVETIFDAPLEMFLKDENRRSEEREWMGEKYRVHYFDFTAEDTDFVIWGLTASILIRAASVVYGRMPSFDEQNPKFRFPKQISGNCIMP